MQTLAQMQHSRALVNLQLQYSLVERNIEREYTDLALELGMGITAWSPLGMGLLSGKYRPGSDDSDSSSDDRLQALKASGLTALQDKFTPRNWQIIATLGRVARESGVSMAQAAIQWAARQPAIGPVILGARTLEQFDDNLAALDVTLPQEAMAALNEASAVLAQFPYSFFAQDQQTNIHGGVAVGDKPDGYAAPVRIAAANGTLAERLSAPAPR